MLSIIVVTFNNFTELVATLDSIVSLKELSFEVVVVNGGGCSQTKKFLEQNIRGMFSNVCWISEKDRGIADAFNKGLSLSKGKYINYLNSGDILLSKKYFKKSVDFLEANSQYAGVHSDIIFNDTIAGKIIMPPSLCQLGRGMPLHHQSLVLRKSVFAQVGNFDETYSMAMDFDLIGRIIKRKFIFYYLKLEKPVILMDGNGVSVEKEWESIKECGRSLRQNKLFNTQNALGFFGRIFFFLLRKMLLRRFLGSYVKKIKYSLLESKQ